MAIRVIGEHISLMLTITQIKAVTSFRGIMHPVTLQKLFTNGLRNMIKSSWWYLGLQIPNWASMAVLVFPIRNAHKLRTTRGRPCSHRWIKCCAFDSGFQQLWKHNAFLSFKAARLHPSYVLPQISLIK